ncbi:hypothetical protein FY528_21010 [Hymenobacter lutimineralis]|uniref:DUF4760 domain-containing protein n=1 Tax=Hymenobacter lutimineralis TaxID=2606448 RepID=A0A5D6UQ20_9BACT|nr:hypothetical protein [Hymenobacter lutimineralis]TYZ05751.1 hypothetical protein FY528_21010 [Hymenobacter lutimineralis]
MNNITIILTSSVISAIISALISAYVSLRAKDIDYKHNYYKEIINKRLAAYQFLETQISVLKSTVLDDDQKAFHLIFAYGREKFMEFQQNLTLAMAYSIWIEEETVEAMQELNDVFFSIK